MRPSLFSAVGADLAYVRWNISPIILDLGLLSLRWYSLLFMTGIFISYQIVRQQFRRAKLPDRTFEAFVMYVLVGMILGMRLGHFLFYEPQVFLERPLEILLPFSNSPKIRFTGYQALTSHGGALGILISLWLFVRKYPTVSTWFLLDQLALVAPLAGAFIRLGNLFNSEMIGHPTTVPWAFVFPSFDLIPRHPTQIYEASGYLLVFVILLAWKQQKKPYSPGVLFSLLLVLLFSVRFIVEFFKINQVPFEDGLILNMGQLLSLPFIVIGVVLFYYRRKNLVAAN